METKKAISRIKYELNFHLVDGIKKDNLFEALDKMEVLLRRSEENEKCKAIINELENCLLPEQYKIVKIIIQRYFSKGE